MEKMCRQRLEPDDLLLDLVKPGLLQRERGCESKLRPVHRMAGRKACAVMFRSGCQGRRAPCHHSGRTSEKEAEEFRHVSGSGRPREQCGFCSPGFIMKCAGHGRELKNRMRRPSKGIWPATCAAAADICPSCGQLKYLESKQEVVSRWDIQTIRHLTGHAACAGTDGTWQHMRYIRQHMRHTAVQAVHMPEEITVW